MTTPASPAPFESFDAWLDAIAAPHAAPAGGAAASLAAALGAALVQMVAGLTLGRPKYAAAHADCAAVQSRAEALRHELAALARRDAEAFAGFGRALALPTGSAAERAARAAARTAALTEGAQVQLALLERVAEAAELAAAMADRGVAGALGDAATGAFLAAAAARSAYWAVRSNLAERRGDPEVEEMLGEAARRLARTEATERAVTRRLEERVR